MARTQPAFDRTLFFQALADETRLRLLHLMGEQEICVCFFVEVLDQPQPYISRHLAYLRRAGLVEVRRDGKWMHYRIARSLSEGAAAVLREALAWAGDEKAMRADVKRLTKACCKPHKFAALEGAPRPAKVEGTCCA